MLAENTNVQILWQCGKLYEETYSKEATAVLGNVKITAFLDRMDFAYAAADLVISRAGALTIAEVCLLGQSSQYSFPSPKCGRGSSN